MGIYFNSYCEDVSEFRVRSEGKEIIIHAEAIPDDNFQSVLFSATDGESTCKLQLEINGDGVCCFIPYTSGERCDFAKHYEDHKFAHNDYGFRHYAQYGRLATCSRNDVKFVSIEVDSKYRLYVTCQLPSSIRTGITVEEFNFSQLAHHLLLCFAKLFGSYVFSSAECDVIERLCPKIVVETRSSVSNLFTNAAQKME